MMMNDDDSSSSSNFKLRVDKVFGSLSSSASSCMWSLTDDEIQKKEWKRDLNRINDDEPIPCSSIPNPRRNLRADDHDVLDDEHHPRGGLHNHNHDEDEFDVRASIGLDSTLDYEEEEDEFDKVAVGKEKAADDCLFMRDALHHINTPPTPLAAPAHLPKDPRANHSAAKLRLKEDDTDAAGNFHSLNLSDDADADKQLPKPILKKREILMPPKSSKRVRFDPQFQFDDDDSNDVQPIHPPPNPNPNLPDYLKNPSNYTCYILDSSTTTDMDDEANSRACMDFLNLIKKPTATTTTTTDNIDAVDSSKPPTFISRKVKSENECKQNQGVVPQFTTPRIGIAVGGDHDNDSEANAMEEDEKAEGVEKTVQKPGRQYRTRTVVDAELNSNF